MAPTAAMLILCHHGKSNSPPSRHPLQPPATSFGLKQLAARWVTVENAICKARSDEKKEHGIVDPPAASVKSIEEVLQLSNC